MAKKKKKLSVFPGQAIIKPAPVKKPKTEKVKKPKTKKKSKSKN